MITQTSRKTNQRKLQAEETRLRILDAALHIFALRGYSETSIKDIALEADIAQGLIYHYFASKEELLSATIDHHSFMPQLQKILKDTKERPCREVFEHISLEYLRLLRRKSMVVKIFMREIHTNEKVREVWSALMHSGSSMLQQHLEQRIRKGELKPHNSEVLARSLFSSLFMFHYTNTMFADSTITPEVFSRELPGYLLDGIIIEKADVSCIK